MLYDILLVFSLIALFPFTVFALLFFLSIIVASWFGIVAVVKTWIDG